MKRPTIKKLRSLPGLQRFETVAEFSNSKGVGGLLSLSEKEDGGLFVELYRCDEGVTIKAPRQLPALRFIVDTYCSTPDRSGNVNRWARITSTVTGRSLSVHTVGGARNIPGAVFKALDPQRPRDFDVWSWLHYGEQDIPRKLFQPPKDAIYEGALTADLILGLEVRP